MSEPETPTRRVISARSVPPCWADSCKAFAEPTAWRQGAMPDWRAPLSADRQFDENAHWTYWTNALQLTLYSPTVALQTQIDYATLPEAMRELWLQYKLYRLHLTHGSPLPETSGYSWQTRPDYPRDWRIAEYKPHRIEVRHKTGRLCSIDDQGCISRVTGRVPHGPSTRKVSEPVPRNVALYLVYLYDCFQGLGRDLDALSV